MNLWERAEPDKRLSGEDAVVERRKYIVRVLERGEPDVVDAVGLDLSAQALATEEMIARAPDGVRRRLLARHHERPVARLREEELAQRLRERAARPLVGAGVTAAENPVRSARANPVTRAW